MADTDMIEQILAKHQGVEGEVEFDRRPVTEAGEIFGNLDNKDLINFNTIGDKEERRCWVILDELNNLGLSVHHKSKLSQTHKEISVSLGGKGREQKKEIAQGMMKAKAGGGGLSALFQRQPPEGGGEQK